MLHLLFLFLKCMQIAYNIIDFNIIKSNRIGINNSKN